MLIERIQKLTTDMSLLEKLLCELESERPVRCFSASNTNDYSKAINEAMESLELFADAVKECDVRIG